ncbi:MAG: type II secretion system secretin GspD [Polyangiales bacterium]|nr:type II secretion system secretin GspD [Myxococcales bacterium]MCB9661240.1 type II secretion system secretin GspD [Sandaracinaceae bacterium]
MKLTTALPLLCFSASVMLAGLSYVDAQEAPPTGARARIRRAQPSVRTRPPNPAANGTSGAEGVTEFDSGVDFRPMSPRARVTFNLEEADLPDLVRLISNMTGKRFILPGKVRAIKATVYAPTKVTAAEAYNAFLSILEVNGLTVVPAGRYLKIMETGGIETQPLGMSDSGAIPAQDRYMTRLQRLDNVSAEDVANLLGRFKSSDGSVIAYAPTNTVIITDTGTQIRRMLRLIEAIDVERTGEQIWIEPIHYATAADLAARLIEIFPPADGSGGAAAQATPQPRRRARAPQPATPDGAAAAGGATATVGEAGGRSESSSITNIIADERTNSLIIIATERAYLRVLEMIRQLDIPLEGEGRIHVHYVQNGDAAEIAGALQELIGGVTSTPATPGPGGRAGAAGAAGATPDLFEGAIRVTSYEPSNALVITSSLHDYAALRTVIDRLDAPRRQVFIEAVIMELSVSRSNTLGFTFHGGVPDFPSNGDLTLLGFDAARTAVPGISQDMLTGVALGIRGQNIEVPGVGLSVPGFGVLVTALASSGDANVLSTPHIIAMDNVEAEISVGQNIPLQTSGIPSSALSSLSGLGGLAGGTTGTTSALGGLAGLAGLAGSSGGFGSAPRQDVGTTIRITPHINQSNQIRMEIEEEISERGATEGALQVVSINRRTAKTEVMARDQQTVVIGGLIRDSVNTSETKVPVLGDIPLIGALFRRTTSQTQKTNLLLFLTPYIIRDPADLRAIFERKMRERQEFLDRYFVFGGDDYEPPIDYSRTRGLIAEMMQNLRELEAARVLAEAAEAEPPPEHVPRAPVGIFIRDAAGGEDVMLIEPDSGDADDGGSAPTAAPVVDGAGEE